MTQERVLVLGAGGMLGHVLVRHLADRSSLSVFATVRDRAAADSAFLPEMRNRVRAGVDAFHFDTVLQALAEVRPTTVVNCIGVIKQLKEASDPLIAIPINALFPHRLAVACASAGARLLHISTDCVFSGRKGLYVESDPPDPEDLYGRSKLLGEVVGSNALTLRTSIIGHGLHGAPGLIDWFLSQTGQMRGFEHAIYSGLPTVELARVIADYVLPNRQLTGLYHVSSDPISKLDLLREVAKRYVKHVAIEPSAEPRCDRSLDSGRFRAATGYVPPPWPALVEALHGDFERFLRKA